MTANPRSVVWDTSCFIDYFNANKKGQRTDEEMGGLESVANSIDRGETNLVIPQAVFFEYLETGAPESQFTRFERFAQRSNVQVVDINSVISLAAREVRIQTAEFGFKIRGVDAVFVATAVLYSVHQLHTFDRDMLRLNERFTVKGQNRRLTICKPGLSSDDPLRLPGLFS